MIRIDAKKEPQANASTEAGSLESMGREADRRAFLRGLAAFVTPTLARASLAQEEVAASEPESQGPKKQPGLLVVQEWKTKAVFDHMGYRVEYNPRTTRLTKGDAVNLLISKVKELEQELEAGGKEKLKPDQIVYLDTFHAGSLFKRVSIKVGEIPPVVNPANMVEFQRFESGRQSIYALTHGILAIESGRLEDGSVAMRFNKVALNQKREAHVGGIAFWVK